MRIEDALDTDVCRYKAADGTAGAALSVDEGPAAVWTSMALHFVLLIAVAFAGTHIRAISGQA